MTTQYQGAPVQPTPATMPSQYDQINAIIDRVTTYEPGTAIEVANDPYKTAAFTEMASTYGDTTPAAALPEEFFQSVFGFVDSNQFESTERALRQAPAVHQFLSRYGDSLQAEELDIFGLVLSNLNTDRRNQVASLAAEYLKARPPQTPEDRANFVMWLYNQGRQKQNEQHQEERGGVLSTIFEVVDTPLEYVSDALRDAWLHTASPEDTVFRKHLSLGQNVALTLGIDPTEGHWTWVSGGVDAFKTVFTDPLNLLFGAGIAMNARRTVPLVRGVQGTQRGTRALKSLIPWKGLRHTSIPAGNRTMSARFFHNMFARSWDNFFGFKKVGQELVFDPALNPRVTRMYEDIFRLSRTRGGIGAIMEKYPQFAESPKLLEVIADPNLIQEPKNIAWWLRGALHGDFFDGRKSRGLWAVERARDNAKQRLDDHTTELLASRRMGLGALEPESARVNFEVGALVENPRKPGTFIQDDLVGDGTEKMVLSSDVAIAKVDDDLVEDLYKWIEDAPNMPGARGLALKVARGSGMDDLTSDEILVLSRFVDARKRTNGVLFNDGTTFLDHQATTSAKRGFDLGDEAGMSSIAELQGDIESFALAEKAVQDIRAGGEALSGWIIKDMPARWGFQRSVKGLWRKHASNDANGWWGNFRRTVSARIFAPEAPNAINLRHAGRGSKELQLILRQMGAKRSFINEAIDQFIRASSSERLDAVLDILKRAGTREAGQAFDNPFLAYGLRQFVDQHGEVSYGFIGNSHAATAASRATPGRISNVPIMPSQLTDTFRLNPGFWDELRRWKIAKGPIPNLTRGILVGTKTKRGRIARAMRKRLKDMMPEEVFRQFSDDDFAAMAFARVLPSRDQSGFGAINKLMSYPAGMYNAMHSIFTMVQLAGRPFSWAGRVLLDEQARAAMMDAPSLLKNPIRHLMEWRMSHLNGVYSKYHSDLLEFGTRLIDDVFSRVSKTDDMETAMREARKLIPRLDDLIEEVPQDMMALRQQLASIVARELIEDNNVIRLNLAVKAPREIRRQRRKVRRVLKLREEDVIPTIDTWDDVPEIQNMGFVQFFAEALAGGGIHDLTFEAGNMSNKALFNYGRLFSSTLLRDINDPVVGHFGLGRAAIRRAGGGESAEFSAQALTRHPAWTSMKPLMQRVGRHNNWGSEIIDNDVLLAQRYLRDVVDPYVEGTFRFIDEAAQTPAEAASNFKSLQAHNTAVIKSGGSTYSLRARADNASGFARHVQDLVQDHATEPWFPPRLAAFFDPKWSFSDDGLRAGGAVRNLANGIMRKFGEDATQTIGRRPAFQASWRRWNRYYKGMGWSDEAADAAAKFKAAENVNYVFYNMSNITPFLRSMNKVFPFFSAAWEVGQTWMYKVPFAQAGLLGAPSFLRKIDRTLEGLVNTGLIEYGDPDENGVRPMFLVIGGDTSTPLGDIISGAMGGMVKAPATVAQHLVNLTGWFDDLDVVPDEMRVQIGNPLNIHDHGIMAVNQFHLGLSPPAGELMEQAIRRIPFLVDEKLSDALEGETLADFAARNDVDVVDLIQRNRSRLIEELDEVAVARLLSGQLQPEDIDLPADFALSLPGTSFARTIIDEMLFPFGESQGFEGFLHDYTPSWSRWVLQGFGMWQGGGDGWLSALMPPTYQASMDGEVINQLRHLEASEGLITQVTERAEAVKAIIDQAVAEGVLAELNTGDISILRPEHPLAQEYQEAFSAFSELNSQLIRRANDNAAGSMFFRGLVGALAPANPVLWREEQGLVDLYYNTREAVDDARLRGSESVALELPKLAKDATTDDILSAIWLWWNDPVGDSAKAWLQSRFPGAAAFLTPKTFWGPGGTPPEIETIEDYFDQVRSGQREVYEPEIWVQRHARLDLATEKEVAIRQRYGTDPLQAAANIINDHQGYSQLMKEYAVEFDALDWWDSEHNEGRYLEWRERNQTDTPTLVDEIQRQVESIPELIDDLVDEVIPTLNMTPEERREALSVLKQISGGLRGFWSNYFDTLDREGYDNPRELAVSQYFDRYYGPYLDRLGELYDKVEAAPTSELRSLAFSEISEFERQVMQTRHFLQGEERAVPVVDPIRWGWDGKTPEERRQKTLEWMGEPPEFLSYKKATFLAEQYPAIAEFLPKDFEIYERYAQMKRQTHELHNTIGPDGNLLLSESQRRRINAHLDEQMRQELISAGRFREIQWSESWPIQRLKLSGDLPPFMDPWVARVNQIQEILRAQGLSGVTGDQARSMFVWLRDEILHESQRNPQLAQTLSFYGEQMFSEPLFDGFFLPLMGGAIPGFIGSDL